MGGGGEGGGLQFFSFYPFSEENQSHFSRVVSIESTLNKSYCDLSMSCVEYSGASKI